MILKKKIILLMSLVFVLVLSGLAFAEYPEKPVNYIVTFNPGGESDIYARAQQPYLKDVLGVNIIVSYKIGGGGAVGWSDILQTDPDGYTFSGFNLPHIILQPMFRKNTGYTTKELKPVYFFMSTPCVLAVSKDSPFETLEDFVNYAKENPGVLTLGGSGSYSANHVGTVEFNKAADIKTVYIPFSGSGEAVPALLGGHVQALMTYTTMGIAHKERMRVLAVAAEERMPALADVPTFKELGYDYVEGAFRGACVPPGTPENIISTLASAFYEVNNNPEFKKRMENMGFYVLDYGPEDSSKLIDEKIVAYKALASDLELK
jgi:tripartite-type tricarboxylate transporter receptor subunit TctC